VSALRASLANPATGVWRWAGLLFPSPYHAVLVVKVCAPCPTVVRLRPGGRLRNLTTALRRAGAGLGNPARFTEPTMVHDLFSFDSSVLLIRDITGDYRQAEAGELLQAAQRLLGQQLQGREVLVGDFLWGKLGALDHEVFAVLMLDAQNRLIEYVELFRGSVSQASVYPREVVKESLTRNAAALVLVHNHPSGVTEPSRADEHLTQTLKAALALVDLSVLGHLIVAGRDVLSFAERGLLSRLKLANLSPRLLP
jgi:DNA repair protein RadC